MKRNAMIRIIIYGTSIALLVAILSTLLLREYRQEQEEAVISAPLVVTPDIVDQEVLYPRIVTDEVNVRSSPNSNATVISFLQKGAWVDVVREETINGTNWAYISNPAQGWVQAEYLSQQFDSRETPPDETILVHEIPETKETIAYQPDQVQALEIEWVAGHILIQPTDTDQILVSESNASDSEHVMVYKLKDGKLSIDFSKEDDNFLSIGTSSDLSKDLTIEVPKDWVCRSLEIDAAAASVQVSGLTITEVEFDGASGTCEFIRCSIDRLDVDTASGDIRITGTLNTLDCDAASAGVLAVLENTPSRLSLDTMSGDLDITLPEDAGFTLTLDSASGEFTSDFTTTVKNGDHVCGDGSCRIRVNALSGNVAIRKAPGE